MYPLTIRDARITGTVLAGATSNHERASDLVVALVQAVAHHGFEAGGDPCDRDRVTDEIHGTRLIDPNGHDESSPTVNGVKTPDDIRDTQVRELREPSFSYFRSTSLASALWRSTARVSKEDLAERLRAALEPYADTPRSVGLLSRPTNTRGR